MPRVAASQMCRALAEAMNVTDVEELVRSVIVHGGLPVAVLSVIESPAGWNIQVRAGTGGVRALRSSAAGRLRCGSPFRRSWKRSFERNR
jgi:hypothetical protein